MKDEKYHYLLVIRIIVALPLIIILYGLYLNISQANGYGFHLLLLITILIIAINYNISPTYYISNVGVGLKYPLHNKIIIKTEDITGYYRRPGTLIPEIVFVSSALRVSIPECSFKIQKEIYDYIEMVDTENIDKVYRNIKESGWVIKSLISKDKYLLSEKGIKIIKTGEQLPWSTVTNIKINTNDFFSSYEIRGQNRVFFTSINASGCIGINKYLLEKLDNIEGNA